MPIAKEADLTITSQVSTYEIISLQPTDVILTRNGGFAGQDIVIKLALRDGTAYFNNSYDGGSKGMTQYLVMSAGETSLNLETMAERGVEINLLPDPTITTGTSTFYVHLSTARLYAEGDAGYSTQGITANSSLQIDIEDLAPQIFASATTPYGIDLVVLGDTFTVNLDSSYHGVSGQYKIDGTTVVNFGDTGSVGSGLYVYQTENYGLSLSGRFDTVGAYAGTNTHKVECWIYTSNDIYNLAGGDVAGLPGTQTTSLFISAVNATPPISGYLEVNDSFLAVRKGVYPVNLSVSAFAVGFKPEFGSVDTYYFNWGDGSPVDSGSSSFGSHTYTVTGTYFPLITAENAGGISTGVLSSLDTPPVTSIQIISPDIFVSIEFNEAYSTLGTATSATASWSVSGGEPKYFWWNFNGEYQTDGLYLSSVNYTFGSTGSKTIGLTAAYDSSTPILTATSDTDSRVATVLNSIVPSLVDTSLSASGLKLATVQTVAAYGSAAGGLVGTSVEASDFAIAAVSHLTNSGSIAIGGAGSAEVHFLFPNGTNTPPAGGAGSRFYSRIASQSRNFSWGSSGPISVSNNGRYASITNNYRGCNATGYGSVWCTFADDYNHHAENYGVTLYGSSISLGYRTHHVSGIRLIQGESPSQYGDANDGIVVVDCLPSAFWSDGDEVSMAGSVSVSTYTVTFSDLPGNVTYNASSQTSESPRCTWSGSIFVPGFTDLPRPP